MMNNESEVAGMKYEGTVEPFWSRNNGMTLYKIGVAGQSKRVIVNHDELIEIKNCINYIVQEDNDGKQASKQ